MKKLFRVNEKRILAKYNFRLFLINLPSIAVLLSLMIIVLLFRPDKNDIPEVIYKAIVYGAYFCCAYSFIACLTGSIIEDILIKAHKKHTYIEISDSRMVISQHTQTVFNEGKFRHYKKLWIINLNELENIVCIKNHIIINGKARYFNENADWLGYESTERGIDFDNWWYNDNGGQNVNEIEVTDFYTHGERIVRRIIFCTNKIKAREQRKSAFHNELLEIAKKTEHPQGLKDRFEPQKQKRKKR